MRKMSRTARSAVAVAAGVVLLLSAGVNCSPSFAQTMYKIPGVEAIAHLVTVRDYEFESDASHGQVQVPAVEFETDEALEKKISAIIQATVDRMLVEQAEVDEEYKRAYLETGGTEEGYRKVETTVDYEKKYESSKLISFRVFKYQTLAPAYNEDIYYTFDLMTGEELKLPDLLGTGFADSIKEQVKEQMIERMEETPDEVYNVEYLEEMGLDETRSFYIDEEGQVVVVFAKYELAAGYMGAQEFIIGNLDEQQ